ncbi:Ankyrin, TRAF-type zinc finger protein [Oopsacas minuta]|uniref:Ankyrin, TRAF-type zinc finger protein n=1 Tax=Oopsacas minuta TaxID=111878 RepID=A0AAV7JDE0_9METZ|nr:Ankyrin, TRAF-type zinc finger protein [Oopsacas minuta]
MAEKSIGGAPELLIDLEQPLLPEIGRELCRVRVRDSDVKGKQGSGEAHVIRTDSLNMGGIPGTTGYKSDREEFRGYGRDILTENLAERESTFLLCNRCKGIMREACISTNGDNFVSVVGNVKNFTTCMKAMNKHSEYTCEEHNPLSQVLVSFTRTGLHVHEKCKLYCGIVLPREELKIHMKEKCEYRKVACEDCKKDFEFCDMLIHQPKCPKVRLKCKEGCGTTVDREDMAQHLEKDCGRVVEKCKLGCGKIVPHDELNMHVNEKCLQRMITSPGKCPKVRLKCVKGCDTTLDREKMAHHLEKDCGRVIENCKLGCGKKLPRDELNMHVNEKCLERIIPCGYCHIDFKAYNKSYHNKKCKKMPISCELGCGILVCREDMARHIEEECVEKKVECPFIQYKCEVGLIKRKELNQHLEEKRTEHTELKLSAMEEIVVQQSEMINKKNERINTQDKMITKQDKMITKQDKMIAKQDKMIAKQSERIAIQNEQLKALFSNANTIKLE